MTRTDGTVTVPARDAGGGRLIPPAYRPVLANRVFRRLILGFAVSYLGDGMSFVAVAWLAIELAPRATAGLWVGGAEVVQEPIDQPYGVRDCAFRDPAGNLVRIQELR